MSFLKLAGFTFENNTYRCKHCEFVIEVGQQPILPSGGLEILQLVHQHAMLHLLKAQLRELRRVS